MAASKDKSSAAARDEFPLVEPSFMLLNDLPLKEKDEIDDESFGLKIRLGPIYDAIRHKKMRPPFAVMVSGGWGTGKSSAMKWLERQLRRWTKEGRGEDKVKVDTAWFYLWKYQDREDVWRGLIATVILASMDFENVDANKVVKAAKQFGAFLGHSFLRALSSLNVKAGDAATTGVEATVEGKELAGIIEEWGKHITPHRAFYNDFEYAFEKWIKDCYKSDTRLCIFIDDLDRCMPDIALQVLEAVKLYLNVENLVFVVGVDKEVIDKIVARRYEEMVGKEQMEKKEAGGATFADKARQYLDKMFQIEVPIAPDYSQIERFLDKQLGKNDLWASLRDYQQIFRWLIIREAHENPRAVVRNVNNVFLGVARVQFAEKGDDQLTPAQMLQQVFLSPICERLGHRDLPREKEGQDFLRAWSCALQGTDGPYYFRSWPVVRSGTKRAPAQKTRAEAEGEAPALTPDRETVAEVDAKYDHLLKVAVQYPRYAPLMTDESLSLVLRVRFPERVGEEVARAAAVPAQPGPAAGVEDAAAALDVLRGPVSRALGIAPEEVSPERIRGLDELDLADNQDIGDNTLAHLKGLTALQTLLLSNTRVTDAGLAHLKGLTALQSLYLRGTRVTERGVAELKKALPKCIIFH